MTARICLPAAAAALSLGLVLAPVQARAAGGPGGDRTKAEAVPAHGGPRTIAVEPATYRQPAGGATEAFQLVSHRGWGYYRPWVYRPRYYSSYRYYPYRLGYYYRPYSYYYRPYSYSYHPYSYYSYSTPWDGYGGGDGYGAGYSSSYRPSYSSYYDFDFYSGAPAFYTPRGYYGYGHSGSYAGYGGCYYW